MEQTSNLQFALGLLEAMQIKPLTQEEKLLVVKKFVENNQLSSLVLFADELDNPESDNLQHLTAFIIKAQEILQNKLDALTNAQQHLSRVQKLKEPPAAEETPEKEEETNSGETMQETSQPVAPPASPYPKGYSKNGIKLGRRPKNKSPEESAPPMKVQTKNKPDKEETPQPKPKETSAESRVESLKYGKEFPIDALYLVDNEYVRTNRLLYSESGVRPVAVIVPYINQNVRCECAVFYDDEHAVIPLRNAKMYARQKIKPFCGKRWRVKSSLDDTRIKPYLPVINEMCKKMGGREIKGNYHDGGTGYLDGNDATYKIRYACDVFTYSDSQA